MFATKVAPTTTIKNLCVLCALARDIVFTNSLARNALPMRAYCVFSTFRQADFTASTGGGHVGSGITMSCIGYLGQ